MSNPIDKPWKTVSHPEFSKRLQQALAGKPDIPQLQYGRLRYIADKWEALYNAKMNVEKLRKWIGGITKPKSEDMIRLASMLEVDPAWLEFGVRAKSEDIAQAAAIEVTSGLVHIVAGLIHLDGGHPAFPEPSDAGSDVNLFAIIRGLRYNFTIVGSRSADGSDEFWVPFDSRGNVVLAVVRKGTMSFEIYELDRETVERVGVLKNGAYRVAANAAEWKLIKDFTTRL